MSCSSKSPGVLISEVGPRDGLQAVKASMPTADKFRWIDALVAAGLREIEVGSFVPARQLPQMADAAEVVRHALTHPGLTVMALVPNLRGAEAALKAGVHKLTIPVSASAAHSLANVHRTREEMIEELRAIVRLRDAVAPQVKVEAGISTAFGCTLQGLVAEDDVVWLASQCIAAVRTSPVCPTPPAWPIRRRCAASSTGCAPPLATRPAPPTCTTPGDSVWPTVWPPMTWAFARLTVRSAVWAAAPTRRALRAMW